ncbi:MAG: cadherin domain-containing protein [Verrucomicrobiales bacterium]|nr:cadherin domain-containing protein [Verrucomicrobiales bacterium]
MKRIVISTALVAALSVAWLIHKRGPESHPAVPTVVSETPAAPTSEAGPALTPIPSAAAPAPSAAAPHPIAVSAPGNGPVSAASPPPLRRRWDPAWLESFAGAEAPLPVRFELTGGAMAEGVVSYIQESADHVVYLAGRLTEPETGVFFFRRQSLPGIAGTHVGVVTLPGSGRAFRLEPSSVDGAPELVPHKLNEVVCLEYKMPPGHSHAAEAASGPEEAPVVDVGQHPTVPIPDYQNGVPVLESLPGARGVVYLDFDGETTTQWDGDLIVAKRPSFTGAQIREIWRYVCADYTSFTINITTDLRVFERAAENSRIHVIITPTTDAAPGAGGVAWLTSWNWTGDTPCWAFGSGVRDAAEQISHEVGHTLGLSHDGRPNEEYYAGHGSGETGWAPIMGVGYYQPVVQWSKGEYANASNKEDDLLRIVSDNTSVDYRADDVGGTFAAGGYLEVFSGGAVTNRGIIERSTDVDSYRFSTRGGQLNLTARPAGVGPNLALRLDLTDAADQLLLTVNPATTLRAVLSTNLPPGDYAIKVRGGARGNSATVGFTTYGSLGYYQLTGVVAEAVEPVRFSVREDAPSGTLISDLNTIAASPGPRTFTATGGSGIGPFALSPNGELTVDQATLLNFEVREQYDLLVDIQYPDNPSLNEIGRRVVVHIADVNELPVVPATTFVVYDRTRSNTVVGSLAASDPDLYTRLRFNISSGNDEGWFAVDGSGALRLTRDLNVGSRSFQLQVQAWDAGTPPQTNTADVTIQVLTPPSGMVPGAIEYARYDDIPGGAIRDLTNDPSFPSFPSSRSLMTNAEVPVRVADNFGGVLRGYFLPPITGSYVFAVAGDDATELRLGTSEQAESAVRIASSSAYTDPRRWTQFPSQLSKAVNLEQGKPYYLEARLKEKDGTDHLSVAWRNADAGAPVLQVIPGRYLAPFATKTGPKFSTNDIRIHRNAFPQARFARIEATDAAGASVFDYELLSSTRPGIAALDNQGWFRVADANLLATTPATDFKLRVKVSIPGGLSSTGTITCKILGPNIVASTNPVVEVFRKLGAGTGVNTLTNNPKFPGRPDEFISFSSDNILRFAPADGEDLFGTRIRGLLTAPASGSFRFYIASDDSSELWLGTSADPSTARVVARVGAAVGDKEWTNQAAQKSAAIQLTARQQYYLEARHKEATGKAHIAVGWSRTGQTAIEVIPLTQLTGVDLGVPPVFAEATAEVSASAPADTVVVDLDAADSPMEQLVWKIAAGDPAGIFAIDPDSGVVRVANAAALSASAEASWELRVAVQDSGYGDLYPRRDTSARLIIARTTAQSPYDAWAAANGIAGSNPGDDGDADGASNQLEFAFGGDPKVADAARMKPRVSRITEGSEARILLIYRRRTDAATAGITYVPEVAATLATPVWTSPGVAGESVSTTAEGLPSGYEEVTLRLASPTPASEVAQFLRIQVTMATAIPRP